MNLYVGMLLLLRHRCVKDLVVPKRFLQKDDVCLHVRSRRSSFFSKQACDCPEHGKELSSYYLSFTYVTGPLEKYLLAIPPIGLRVRRPGRRNKTLLKPKFLAMFASNGNITRLVCRIPLTKAILK
jgi:hypothetical protein